MITVVKLSGNEKPWLTPAIKHLINLRWAAFRDRDFVRYMSFKLKVQKEIAKAKLRWGLRAKRSAKDLWKVTKNVIGQSKVSMSSILNKFPTQIDAANAINTVFSHVFNPSSLSTPNGSSCPVDLRHPTIHVHAVFQELKKLKPGKSCGPDRIPSLFYKEAAVFLAEPLTHLFNMCLSQGLFPSFWKRAHVVPIPKKRNPTERDLRPISLLSTPSKIFEKILSIYLRNQFRDAADREQHGGIVGRSTSTALITVHDCLTRLMDRDDISGAQLIAYDISKAFDKLSGKVVISQLQQSNFPPFFVHLMSSYLSNRSQCVKLNGAFSESLPVTSGVPQGSVLGPLLFLTVMGTLEKRYPETGLVKFMDDVTLVVPIMKACSNHNVNEEDDNFRSWADRVGLTINETKSKCIVYQRSPNFSPAA